MLVDAREVRRRRDPGLLLRAQARRAGRRVPHVPGRDRGHPEAPDRAARRRSRTAWSSTRRPTRVQGRAGGGGRVPADQPPARLPRLRQGRRVPAAGHLLRLGRRHLALHRAQAPLREAARAVARSIAIDRERCILCYRCVRFSQEVAEDYQLVLQERGAHSFVGTFDGHPYVAPFSGNIIELCPVGALTSQPYRFRARPWDIEQRGLGLHALPGAVQRQLHRARRARPARARARQRRGRRRLAVRQGPLRLPGRPRRRAHHAAAAARRRRAAPGHAGSARSTRPRRRSTAPAAASARWPAAATTNEEGFLLQRLMREALGSPTSTRAPAARSPAELHRALAAPGAAGDGRRPRVRARRARARLRARRRRADPRPAHAQGRAPPRRASWRSRRAARRRWTPTPRRSLRFAPGAGEALLAALDAALAGATPTPSASSPARPAHGRRGRARWPRCCATAGEDVVILCGERLLAGPRGAHAARALLNVAGALGLAGRDGAGLLGCPPPPTAAACARRACCPDAGPGLRRRAGRARRRARSPPRPPTGELTALYLLHVDPLRDLPGRGAWERALERATTVDRARELPDRGHRRARDRRLPGRVLRREGGHGHAPRRPPPAPAPGDRPPGRRCAPSGRCSPTLAQRLGPRPRRAAPARWPRASSSRRCRSTPA